jgi:DNA (cytosine-5)-methyltransferase 1
MTHGSLFSGIGGFDLASEWMGWENLFHCEWNDFGQTVLKHYWPNAHTYHDITKSDFTIWNGRIDVLTGGFPCQPYSQAGKRLGKEDDRHLWPEMLRAIREIQPRWVVGENVLGLVNWNGGLVFDEVQADLEAQGYQVQPYVLPACAVNAPHRRDRVWFVAYADDTRTVNAMRDNGNGAENDKGRQGKPQSESWTACGHDSRPNRNGLHECYREHEIEPSQRGVDAQRDVEQIRWDDANGKGKGWGKGIGQKADIKRRQVAESGQERYGLRNDIGTGDTNYATRGTGYGAGFRYFPTQSPICGRNDGLPTGLDGITFSKWRQESIKAYGNAIVPQVAYQIFKSIQAYEDNL